MKIWNLILFITSNFGCVYAQDPGMYFLKADKLYKDSSYQDAEEHYRQAHVIKPGFKSSYNIGNSLYQQGRSQEAIDYYKNSLLRESDQQKQAKAYYNLGNAYFHNQQFDKSVEAYKEVLKRQPADNDARNNLMLAKKQLMQQQQQQQQQEKQQQQKEQQPSDNNEAQEPQAQEEQKSQNKEEQQTQKQEDSPSKMNKEQMEQLLRMAGEQDQKTRQKLQKAQSKSPKRAKDW